MGSIDDVARRADRHDWVDHAVRFGLVAYGLVHLMIAWLAAQLALGDKGGSASSSGALMELSRQPFGAVLVWMVAIGMFLLVAWRLLEAVVGEPGKDGTDAAKARVVSLFKAVLYAVIGVSALQVATSDRRKGGGGGGSDTMTAQLMQLPAGQWIVGAVGLGIIGYGFAQVRRSWTEKFRKHLSAEGKSGDAGTAYIWFGKIGYAAKGVAVGVVGGLFVYAAVTHDADKSGGLDQALQEIRQQQFGQWLLLAVAVGIGCYGLFCFARARHLSR